MKKFLLLAFTACLITACQTMDSVKSGFSDSYTKVSNLFRSDNNAPVIVANGTPCPSFSISDELDNYYDIPGVNEDKASGFSRATLQTISGNCRLNPTGDIITIGMDINFSATAAGNETQTLEVPYFIAVLDIDQEILSKDTFTIPFDLTNTKGSVFHTEQLQQNIPVLEGEDPSTYSIIAGFQLNQPQLAFAKVRAKDIPKEVPVEIMEIEPAAGDVIDPDTVAATDPFADR